MAGEEPLCGNTVNKSIVINIIIFSWSPATTERETWITDLILILPSQILNDKLYSLYYICLHV
jgi:hypothetical protein